MTGDPIQTKILSLRILPNADPMLLERLQVPPGHRSLGLFTADCDDVSYARSMYAGAGNASTALAGEFIGILSWGEPRRYPQRPGGRRPLRPAGGLLLQRLRGRLGGLFRPLHLSHGSYLSHQAQVPEGTAMAYLIAPPLEAMVGLDAALKAADVTLRVFYGPPSETNFAGGCSPGTRPPAGRLRGLCRHRPGHRSRPHHLLIRAHASPLGRPTQHRPIPHHEHQTGGITEWKVYRL